MNRFNERIELLNHDIHMSCIDLSAPWQDIESKLLELITEK